jgi:hypothetical protein
MNARIVLDHAAINRVGERAAAVVQRRCDAELSDLRSTMKGRPVEEIEPIVRGVYRRHGVRIGESQVTAVARRIQADT